MNGSVQAVVSCARWRRLRTGVPLNFSTCKAHRRPFMHVLSPEAEKSHDSDMSDASRCST